MGQLSPVALVAIVLVVGALASDATAQGRLAVSFELASTGGALSRSLDDLSASRPGSAPAVQLDEYDRVEPGARARALRRRPGHGLRAAGWILLSTTYGFALLQSFTQSALDARHAWQFAVPLVGPGVFGTGFAQEDEAFLILGVGGWLYSAAQLTGLILLIIGHWMGSSRSRSGRGRPAPAWGAAPPSRGRGG